eukprot:scaffold7832_cov106-Isochrysis_galbana.AAC.10
MRLVLRVHLVGDGPEGAGGGIQRTVVDRHGEPVERLQHQPGRLDRPLQRGCVHDVHAHARGTQAGSGV